MPIMNYVDHIGVLRIMHMEYETINWGVVSGHTPGPPCKSQLISL